MYSQPIIIYANTNTNTVTRKRQRCIENKKEDDDDIVDSFSPTELTFWKSISPEEKVNFIKKIKIIKDPNGTMNKKLPLRFKILTSDISESAKALIINKIEQFNSTPESSSDYYKLRNWLNSLDNLPLGYYKPLPVSKDDPIDKAVVFLDSVKNILEENIYGHIEAKQQILRVMAQWISNPSSQGYCIGLQGSMGVGKTTFVKDGIAKALGLPFGFISLGGASDGCIMEGHSYTYEGSSYGKICEVLMKAKCMNPIIFFDELDKVSNTSRGDEIIGILTHLTDSSQNDTFTDRYFGEIDINLSKALIIFSYNDESRINPILKDRMITIRVKGYNTKDKLCIAQNYLIPKILKQYNFNKDDIIFPNQIIESIINKINTEEGVRSLKRGLDSIVSWMNMYRYIPPASGTIVLPITITEKHVSELLGNCDINNKNDIIHTMYI